MRILVLAGTTQAREVIAHLHTHQVIASLAGAVRSPADLGVPTRIGGFGGAQGLADYITQERIDMVIDATHPFAEIITNTAVNVCREAGIKYAMLTRPPWVAQAGDDWHRTDGYAGLPQIIPDGVRIFAATGRGSLPALADLSATRHIVLRLIDKPDTPFPYENGEFIVARPPFTRTAESALFKRLNIDWLLIKNAGGGGGEAKIHAARELGLPIAMINPPVRPKNVVIFEAIAPLMGMVNGEL